MSSSIVSYVSYRRKVRQFVGTSSVVGAALLLGACHNYTAEPLCTDENTIDVVDLPGFAGTYEYTVQNDDFSTSTEIIELPGDGAKGFPQEDDGSAVCLHQGKILVQSVDEEVGYYDYSELSIDSSGLTSAPVFFDRFQLEAAGVATETLEIPDLAKHLLAKGFKAVGANLISRLVDDAEASLMLVINTSEDYEAVMASARTGPVALKLRRIR